MAEKRRKKWDMKWFGPDMWAYENASSIDVFAASKLDRPGQARILFRDLAPLIDEWRARQKRKAARRG